MKKSLSVVLALCVSLGCLVLPAAAAQTDDAIRLRIRSDVAGCMAENADELIEILSSQVVLFTEGSGPVHISNYAGATEHAHMEAGRSYYLEYTLAPADGYELPDAFDDDDVSIECGKGVSLLSCKVINLSVPDGSGHSAVRKVMRICATVVVDGTPFQRFIGWIRDIILKIRSWQLY